MKRMIFSYIAIVIGFVFVLSLIVGEPRAFGRGLMIFLVVPGLFMVVTVICAILEARNELKQEEADKITSKTRESHELALVDRSPANVSNVYQTGSSIRPNVVNNYFVVYKSDELGADLEELPSIEGEWVELRA